LHEKFRKIARHPATRKILTDMKPEKSLWGILGVVFFFIAPEVIAYFYAVDIVRYAQNGLSMHPSLIESYNDKMLIYLFEDGVSWFNLGFGVVLLVWLFF
jgi:hypothetical protein